MEQPAWLQSKIVLAISIVIMLVIVVNFFNSWQKAKTIDQEITDLEQERITLEQAQEELSGLINYLNSTAYLEKKARTDLGLKKIDENVVIIPDFDQPLPTEEQIKKQKRNQSNPTKWWRYFFSPS